LKDKIIASLRLYIGLCLIGVVIENYSLTICFTWLSLAVKCFDSIKNSIDQISKDLLDIFDTLVI